MKSITRLFSAAATLAGSLEALALLVDTVSAKLRMSLALDGSEPADMARLAGPEENAATDTPEPARRKVKASA